MRTAVRFVAAVAVAVGLGLPLEGAAADTPAAQGVLGDAGIERGDYRAAVEHYRKMLDVRLDLSSYRRAAYLSYLIGDARKAIWSIEKAIEAGDPYAEDTARCRAQLARMLFDQGALLAAERAAAKALEYAPGNPDVLSVMGRIKAARNDYPAAIGFYDRALAVAAEHDTLVALGDLHRLTGNLAEAEKRYSQVEKLRGRNRSGDLMRSDLRIAKFDADHDRNLTEALRLAERHEASANVFDADAVAWSYYKNGRYEQAKQAIGRALRLGTQNAEFLFHAGMIHAKLNERSAARNYLYRALSLNPYFSPLDAPVANRMLGQLEQGGPGDAR